MIEGVARLVCEQLLNQLDDSVLRILADISTNNSIVVASRPEAISIILDYSEEVKTLLERQKMQRNYLTQFFHTQGVRNLSKETKPKLIERFLDYIRRQQGTHSSTSEPRNVPLALPNAPAPMSFGATSMTFAQPVEGFEDSHKASTSKKKHSRSTSENRFAFFANVADVTPEKDDVMSGEFVSWFYPMLNSLNGGDASREWKSDIFLPGCKFSCVFRNNGKEDGSSTTTICSGPAATRKAFEDIMRQNNLCFNANNTPNGRKAIMKAHDVAKVGVCGLLRQSSQLGTLSVGAFEQIFQLKFSPHMHTWKIKLSELTMTSSSKNSMPTLSENALLALRS
ncbi:uncharacterized protein C3orf38 homolog [Clavelina lepadiformis]|uniref:uncharacterized protein C3orf38 homolog n=1 Tax=Clavelina lepadiformis TaxID=159417 RepID=UPI0040434764